MFHVFMETEATQIFLNVNSSIYKQYGAIIYGVTYKRLASQSEIAQDKFYAIINFALDINFIVKKFILS